MCIDFCSNQMTFTKDKHPAHILSPEKFNNEKCTPLLGQLRSEKEPLTPVALGLQHRDNHPPAGRSMNKFSIAQVDTRVCNEPCCGICRMEKDKVASFQFFGAGDNLSKASLLF